MPDNLYGWEGVARAHVVSPGLVTAAHYHRLLQVEKALEDREVVNRGVTVIARNPIKSLVGALTVAWLPQIQGLAYGTLLDALSVIQELVCSQPM